MERLTQKDDCGNWSLKDVEWNSLYEGEVITSEVWEKLYVALCKLLEYEEMGLEPEQMKEISDFYAEKCREVVELKKRLEEQGLLLRLHCKVGDTVYGFHDAKPIELNVVEISIFTLKTETIVNYKCQNADIFRNFTAKEFGKYVFLTMEEAEAKLEEMRCSK